MNIRAAVLTCLLLITSTNPATATEADIQKWKTLSDSALALRDGGNCPAAITIWTQAQKIVKKSNLHDSLLSSTLGNIGYCYSMLADYSQAINFLAQSASLDSAIHGPKSEIYASALSPLGVAYLSNGNLVAARSTLATCVKIFSRTKDQYTYWYISALTNYGMFLEDAGENDEAERQFRKCISVSKNQSYANEVQGYCYGELGRISINRGDWEKAEKNLNKSLKLYSESESAAVAIPVVQNVMLNLYEMSGQRKKYQELYTSMKSTGALAQLNEVDPIDRALRECGEYLTNGDIVLADSTATARMFEIENQYGKESSNYIDALQLFADLYYMSDLPEQQVVFLETMLPLIESTYGKNSPRLLGPLVDLGGSSASVGPKKRLELLEQANSIIAKNSIKEYPKRHSLESALGSAYDDLAKPQDAYTHYERALQASREIFGKDAIEVGEALVTLGVGDYLAGYLNRLEKHMKAALKIFRKHSDTPAVGYPIALMWLSTAYEAQERWLDAIGLLIEVVHIKSTWPITPPLDYAMHYNSLSDYYYKLDIRDSAMLMHKLYVERTAVESGMQSEEFSLALSLQEYRLLELADTAAALRVAHRQVSIIETHRATNDPEIVSVLQGLSNLMYLNDMIDSAVIIADSAYQVSKRIHGADTPETNEALQQLIAMQRAAGKYRQAEINAGVYLAPTANSDTAQFDSMTIVSMRELAIAVYQQGDFPKAERLLVDLLMAQEIFYGKNSPEVFYTLNYLSMTYTFTYKYKKMKEVTNRAIDIAPLDEIGVHGELSRLYSTLLNFSRMRSGYEVSQRLVDKMREEALLDNINRDNLYLQAEEAQISLYIEMRKFTEADSTVASILSYAETHDMGISIYLLSVIRRGAYVLFEVEDYDSALERYHSIYPNLTLKTGADTSFFASLSCRLGEALTYAGNFDSAKVIFARLGALIKADIPIAQPQTVLELLGSPFSPFGELQSGEASLVTHSLDKEGLRTGKPDTVAYTVTARQFTDSLEKSIYLDSARLAAELQADIKAADFPRRNHYLQDYFLSLGKAFEFQGKLDSAEHYYDQSSFLLHNTSIFKPITLAAIEAQVLLGDLYMSRGQLKLAEIAYHVAIDTLDITTGEWMHYSSLAHLGLGMIYESQGNLADAEEEYRFMASNSEATKSPVSLDVAESLTTLATFLYRQNKLREAAEILNRAQKMIADVYGESDLRRLVPLLALYQLYQSHPEFGSHKKTKKEITAVVTAQENHPTLIKRSTVKLLLAALEALNLKNQAKLLSDARAKRY